MAKLIILGGGESGVGSAVLGKLKGYDVFLSDAGTLKQKYIDELELHGIASGLVSLDRQTELTVS